MICWYLVFDCSGQLQGLSPIADISSSTSFKSVPLLLYHGSSCADEQDTNTTQYELMRCFANANGGLSVVGDPDQSIYGWRSAEIENLNKMTRGQYGPQMIPALSLSLTKLRVPGHRIYLPRREL